MADYTTVAFGPGRKSSGLEAVGFCVKRNTSLAANRKMPVPNFELRVLIVAVVIAKAVCRSKKHTN